MKKNILNISRKILPVSKNQFSKTLNLADIQIKNIENLNNLLIEKIDRLTNQINKLDTEVHKHIDFTYRDLMIVLEKNTNFIPKHKITLKTKNPIAFESNDHKVPHGTIRDNTRYPRFIRKCELLFPKKEHLYMLDLGCSGGGMVLDACLRDHIGIGLEGSDSSLIMQRAEWRLLRKNLFTCDITKPFKLIENNKTCRFDVITAWEVMEHLPEESLDQFFENLKKHMNKTSLFICSIAAWNDIDPITKVNWHVNVKPLKWWIKIFNKSGFQVINNVFDEADFPRGRYNPSNFYENQYINIDRLNNFNLTVKKS